jgi:hypothetical protein
MKSLNDASRRLQGGFMEIVAYLQGIGLSVEPEGGGWKVKQCLFCGHNDCFKVSPEGFFKCFSCGNAGDAIKFESIRSGITYQEAKQKLTGATVLAMPDPERDKVERNHKRLTDSPEYLSWLTERRKIPIDVIKRFKIGCFIADDQKVHYSFPYWDGSSVANVKYRTVDKQIYFRKGGTEFLFNRNALRNSDRVLVVEGEIDCLSAYSYKLKMPCLSVGLGAGNMKLGWKNDFANVSQVLIAFDNDDAGRSGAVKLAEMLGPEKCRIVRLPDAFKDLNEALVQGLAKEDIEECISRSLLLDQVEIFHAIDAIPHDEPVLGEKIKGVLKMIAERPSAEVEDYIRAIRQRFSELSYRQVLDFRSQVKTIRHFSKESEIKESAEDVLSIPEDIKADAMALLKSRELFETISSTLTDLGLVGEDLNKVPMWLFMLSRKLAKPIHAVVFGQSSSGKSELVKTVIKTIPEEDVLEFSSMTARSLDYRDGDLIDKVIFIAEFDGADEISYSIRVAQSEGRLTRATTIKDPETGEMRNFEKTIEVKSMFVLTTTRSAIHNENYTRVFGLYADESVKQTQRVIEFIKQSQTRDYQRQEPERKRRAEILKAAQRLLKPVEVNISFAHLIEFPDGTTRNRRDMSRFLSFLKVIAYLRQFQKEVKTDEIGTYVEADLEDYFLAHHYLLPIIRNTLEDLTPRSMQVLEVSCLVQSELRQSSLLEEEDGTFTVKHLQEKALKIGVDFRNVVNLRQELQSLCDQEYIELVGGAWGQKGGRHHFKVLAKFDLDSEGHVANIQTNKPTLLTPSELSSRLEQSNKK